MIQRETPSSLIDADLNVLQSLGALIDDFSQPTPVNQKHVTSHWFGFLPSVYGRSRTLDATIKSFVAHHFGKALQNEQMVLYARSAYGEALHRLRKSLANPSECLSTHVFCAVVLLCTYEVRTTTALSSKDKRAGADRNQALYGQREPGIMDETRQRNRSIGQDQGP